MSAPKSNWDGHEFDPAGRLDLPERIVDAAETAIEESRTCRVTSGFGDMVEGFTVDFARSAAGAAIDAIADDFQARGVLSPDQAGHLRVLAQAVRDVRALKAV